jgi:hypothetical protein
MGGFQSEHERERRLGTQRIFDVIEYLKFGIRSDQPGQETEVRDEPEGEFVSQPASPMSGNNGKCAYGGLKAVQMQDGQPGVRQVVGGGLESERCRSRDPATDGAMEKPVRPG